MKNGLDTMRQALMIVTFDSMTVQMVAGTMSSAYKRKHCNDFIWLASHSGTYMLHLLS